MLGTYDALKNPAEVVLKPERIKHWLSVGALPSDTVKSIFKRHMQD